jgi:DNA-binding transcriptional MocR family regulator
LAGRYSGLGDGLHVWSALPSYGNTAQIADAGAISGIVVTPTEATGSEAENAIRISLGTIKDRGHLQAGIQWLSLLLAKPPETFSAAVL